MTNARFPFPGITTDQRGSARIVNGTVDIGAFESRGFTITVTSGNNQQTVISTAFAAPLVVTVSSPYGEPVQGGVVSYTAPASGASATFPGGGNTAAIDASGQASIAVAANTILGSYTVSASAGGAAGTSFSLTNTLGPPTQLVIHAQPSATATAGRAFATQPVIYEEDQQGNLETRDNSTHVTVSLESGSGPLEGATIVPVVRGIATFNKLSDNDAETIVLLFSSNALAQATSSPIIVSKDPGNALIIGAKAKTKVKESSRGTNRHAIRVRSVPATTKAHTPIAEIPRTHQSSAVPAGASSSLQAVPTANHARTVVKADSAPVRAPAELKGRLLAYLIALRHAGSDLG